MGEVTTMPAPDTELVQGFLDGDPVCLKQIDVWILEVLRHPSLRLQADSEDVAQQVRRKLLISFRGGHFQGTATLRTYVWRVAQHAAIDHLRARRTRPPVALLRRCGGADRSRDLTRGTL